MTELAINGGEAVRTTAFPAHVTHGQTEKDAVIKVLEDKVLSNYLGAWHDNFMGGKAVRACEAAWASHFKAKHALAMNSNTSGLIAAVGALGIGPGDEVIVTAYSMSISATAPLFWGATPVFADIEPDTFCLSKESIEAVITDKTRAIIVVDLFGQPFDVKGIRALADKHNLKIIEDAAQSPGGSNDGVNTGLLGDIGVFSLNYHKHIHTGEGGIIVTNDDDLVDRLSMIRNHAECVVGPKNTLDLTNMLGFNFRMTEIEAALAEAQLSRLDSVLEKRWANVKYFENKMRGFEALKLPVVRAKCVHSYYVHACKWQRDATDISRNSFIDAVKAELPVFALREKEGVKLGYGYVKPIYELPLFHIRNTSGLESIGMGNAWQNFSKGLCPVVEDMHYKTLVSHEFIVPSMNHSDIDDVVLAFEKVWELRDTIGNMN